MYGNAEEWIKFFWFFLSTKRTPSVRLQNTTSCPVRVLQRAKPPPGQQGHALLQRPARTNAPAGSGRRALRLEMAEALPNASLLPQSYAAVPRPVVKVPAPKLKQ